MRPHGGDAIGPPESKLTVVYAAISAEVNSLSSEGSKNEILSVLLSGIGTGTVTSSRSTKLLVRAVASNSTPRATLRVDCHPDQSFYYRQITRQLQGVSSGTVPRELDTLSQLGLIQRSAVGKQVFYKANRSHPVFPELRTLVEKTVGVFQVLHSARAPLADRISLAFIYGSLARRGEKAESDIDLLIVGEVALDDVLARLSDVESSLGRAVNPTVYSATEFKSKLATGNHFSNSVVRGEKVS